ncbi:plasmid mobilization relaxosome protein MobC [Parvibaculaceae bacterium PLY_AMNH_Bact1]|nr:plasmid mobilization relaxosome protein MobC [Parvibaculaceae bacterium PLY_AMNH_Bact1]
MPTRDYRKPESERRTRCVKTYFTAGEFAQLQEAAEASGLTHAAFVRASALGNKPQAKPTRVAAETIRQLTALGNNLNQLTKIAHAGKFPVAQVLETALGEVLSAVRRIG